MDFLVALFVSEAAAQTAAPAAAAPGGLNPLLFVVLMFVVLYFLMIRPQQKKDKERRQMIDSLAVGAEVVTGGGVLGKVVEVSEQFLTVEVAERVRIKVQRHSIGAVLPKDTIKNA